MIIIKLLDVYLDNNIGDDLMLKMFLAYFHEETFHIVNSNEKIKSTFSSEKNLIFINKLSNEDVRKITHYITIGGSVFNNTTTLLGKAMRIKRYIFLKKLKRNNVKIMTVGSNLGPFTDIIGEKIVQLELNLNSLVTVRDKYSYNIVQNNNKFLFDDIVMSLLETYPKYKRTKMNSKIFGISVHNNKNDSINEKTIKEIKNAIIKLIEQNQVEEIRLFNFDILNENDLKISSSIFSQLPLEIKNKVEIVSYEGNNQEEFINSFSECYYIMGLRFHSMILASVFEQKYLGYSYSNKMIEYAKTWNYHNVFDIEDISNEQIFSLDQYVVQQNLEKKGCNHFSEVGNIIDVF